MNSNIEFADQKAQNKNILAYIRSNGSEQYAVVINFGETSSVSINEKYKSGFVEVATGGIFEAFQKTIDLGSITLKKGDGLVIRL